MSLSENDTKSLELLHQTLNAGVLHDNSPLVQVFANKTEAEIAPIREAYHDIKHDNLETKIKSKLSGDYEYAILAIATQPAVYDARTIRSATKGLGTDETTLIEILATRTPAQLEAINVEYKNQFNSELVPLIDSETGGKLRDAFRLVLGERTAGSEDKVGEDVTALYDAAKGFGTDEKVLINVIAGQERAHILNVAEAYQKVHGKELVAMIKSELGGDLRDLLVALATPVHVFLAEKLLKAFTKLNTDEEVVTRIFITQRETTLTEISHYLNSNGKPNQRKPLAQWATEKTGGNLKTFLNAIAANFVSNERA